MQVLCVNWHAPDEAALERARWPEHDFDLVHHAPGATPTLTDAQREGADAVINYSATDGLGAAPDGFPRCRVVVRAGVGYDNLDLAGWAARGVPACNVPDYGTTEVADHAIALMLALTRGTATYGPALRDDPVGGWRFGAAPLVRRLRGATFGILGLGRIGLATGNRAAAFGMRVVFHDPYLPAGTELAVGFERVADPLDLARASDVLSLHLPLDAATRGIVGADMLAVARPGLVLVNTARGPLVDLDALHAGLRSGRIGGAALDVLPQEPADAAHPLIATHQAREPWLEGRLVLSPHAAFYSPASLEDLRVKSVEVALAALDGRVINRVNASP